MDEKTKTGENEKKVNVSELMKLIDVELKVEDPLQLQYDLLQIYGAAQESPMSETWTAKQRQDYFWLIVNIPNFFIKLKKQIDQCK